jgi:hypothetical protein
MKILNRAPIAATLTTRNAVDYRRPIPVLWEPGPRTAGFEEDAAFVIPDKTNFRLCDGRHPSSHSGGIGVPCRVATHEYEKDDVVTFRRFRDV